MNRLPSRKLPLATLTVALALAACISLTGTRELTAQIIIRGGYSTLSGLADIIFSEADYLRASGDFLVSAGVARNLNADAASKEMDNAVKWVNTYFERRRLNREWRDAEHVDYLEHLEKGREQQYRIINENLDALGGDLSDELNFMLRDLLANTSHSIFMSQNPGSLIGSDDNLELSAVDCHQIRVSEGKLAGGKSLVFRVDTAQMLETRWPMVLRDELFDMARGAFEEARDSALDDLKIGQEVSRDHSIQLMDAVDQLTAELTAAYPREILDTISPRDGLAYGAAVRFLRSLAMSTYRLIETQSSAAFDESYRFQGKSVAELLQHMATKGLEFAPAEPGGEGVYRKLYGCVRAFYLQLVPKPEPKNGQ